MKIPKSPVEFDYDLWKTEGGKCMVRVKRTGEECEVDTDTFRLLRAEEKRLRRSMKGTPVPGCENGSETAALLSLDAVGAEGIDGMSTAWLEAPDDTEEAVMLRSLEEELRLVLTSAQMEVYTACLLGGTSYKEFADRKGVSYQSVQQAVLLIRKKAAKIFL